jgi:uncharacterized membrane protein
MAVLKHLTLALILYYLLFHVTGCAQRQTLWQQMGSSLIRVGHQMGGK